MDLGITAYSAVTPKGVFKNGTLVYGNETKTSFDTFAKEAYRFINPSYPKFFKMDALCKLAFLATEVLLTGKNLGQDAGADVALVVGNKHSSLIADLKHYDSFKDRDNYFPSPAVFVYTLPNIMLGEICIRHQITGENSCFIMDHFNADFLFQYVKNLFETEDYNYCLTGWIDNSGPTYNAHLFLIERWDKEHTFMKKFDKDFNKINTNGEVNG